MNIRYKEYHLEQEDTRFNLYKVGIHKNNTKRKKEGDEKLTNIAFSMSWEHAIKNIIALEAQKDENTYSLNEFIAKYKKIADEVMQAIKIDEYTVTKNK